MWKSRFLSPPTCSKRDDGKPAAAPKEVSAIIRKESARDKALDEMSQDGWMSEDAPGRRLLNMNIAMNIHTHVYLYHLQSEICKICDGAYKAASRLITQWRNSNVRTLKSAGGAFITGVFRRRLCLPHGVFGACVWAALCRITHPSPLAYRQFVTERNTAE